MTLDKVPRRASRPPGYRTLGYAKGHESPKAAAFDYHGQEVWIPFKALVYADGRFHAAGWAVHSSLKFQQSR
ncbi:MAG TPA: hypothetical protein VGL66_19680 [Caulobacteraceae bacterium]|jgi:hypothetical protein